MLTIKLKKMSHLCKNGIYQIRILIIEANKKYFLPYFRRGYGDAENGRYRQSCRRVDGEGWSVHSEDD